MDSPTAATGRGGAFHPSAPAGVAEDLLRDRLVRARVEALAEWGVPLEDAREIAAAVDVDIVSVVDMLQRGCPAELVLSILT